MTKAAYAIADNLLISLGFTTDEVIGNIRRNKSGICRYEDPAISPVPFCASRVDDQRLQDEFGRLQASGEYTRLEKMLILSAQDALQRAGIDPSDPATLFILSTTKGNIDLLDQQHSAFEKDRIFLWKTARILGAFFGNPNTPLVVSNACISGIIAIIAGSGLIQSSRYQNVVVIGGDLLTHFVVSGFQSFKALSSRPCKPFDAERDGLSLGEGCGTVVLSSQPGPEQDGGLIVVTAGSSTNDANHISGPSRTGEGLFLAIRNTLQRARKQPQDIDFISAHGTATVFNDEMESIAFSRCGLETVPVNSLKGYFGHTLGAAGVIESIVTVRSMLENTLFPTCGFEKPGVSKSLQIVEQPIEKPVTHSLKTAAGFGGCNAAALFSKDASI